MTRRPVIDLLSDMDGWEEREVLELIRKRMLDNAHKLENDDAAKIQGDTAIRAGHLANGDREGIRGIRPGDHPTGSPRWPRPKG